MVRRIVICLLLAFTFPIVACAQFGTSRLTNKSGSQVAQYSIVVIDDSNALAFKTTTTERDTPVAGITAEAIDNNATGKVVLFGVYSVSVSGSVTNGDYLVTSTTAGKAISGGTANSIGAFAVALEDGTDTTVDCMLIPANAVGAYGDLSEADIDTETELETILTDVANVFTDNDNIEAMSTAGASGTAPVSNGDTTLTMTEVVLPTDIYQGATESAAGVSGLLPNSTAGTLDRFFCVDGTFKAPSIGAVTGPGTSTDNAAMRWDGTNGDTAQNSTVTISDAGAIVIPGTLTVGSSAHVLTNSAGLIDGGKIQTATVTSTQLSASGVVADSYTLAGITIDSAGRITAAQDGSVALIDLSDGETAYTGAAGYPIVVSSGETSWEFASELSPTVLPVMVGDSGSGGTAGIVPAPGAGDAAAGKFLAADGTFAVPSGTGNVAGPASSTDNAIALFDGDTGQLLQDSSILSSDGSSLVVPGTLTAGSGANVLTNSAGLIDGGKIQPDTVTDTQTSDTLTIGSSGSVDARALVITAGVDGTEIDNADTLLIYDTSLTAVREITRANFLSGSGDDMGAVDTEAEFEAALTDVTDVLTNNDANYAYMINSAGTSGQVWTSDGDGRGAWATATGGASAFTDLSDVPAAYTGQAGKVVAVNSGETALEFIAGGGGASAFTDLSDAPSAYTSQGGKYVRVNTGETGLEFATVSGGSAGPDTLCVLLPHAYFPPATAYATRDTRNNTPVLDFDATTDESAMWLDILPVRYAGGGITVEIVFAATSATSGDVVWCAQIERIGSERQDLDADGFASAKTVTVTTSGTSGYTKKASLSFANGAEMDSVAAGEAFRVKIYRDADNTADTATGDAELVAVHMKETP